MIKIYDQTIKKINSHPNPEYICTSFERQAVESWKDKFLLNSELYGSQNGNYPWKELEVGAIVKKSKLEPTEKNSKLEPSQKNSKGKPS